MNIFQKTTVDSVMAGFTKTLDQLRYVRDVHRTTFNNIAQDLNLLKERQDAALTEAERADALAAKFEELLG